VKRPESLWRLHEAAAGEALQIPRLQFLETLEQCDMVLRCDGGFLMGISSRQAVDNFVWHWFMMRLDSFLYIDRVIIAQHLRRQGHASALMEKALEWGREQGMEHLVCQVHERPPNPAAHALCKKLGFSAIESVMLPSRDIVTMYQRSTASATP